MKVLVVVAHPGLLDFSKIHLAWTKEIEHLPNLTLHSLYETYKSGEIDVNKEQQLMLDHDRYVFQFPFYWFSSPPLLKEWFDMVLQKGFSHGPNGSKINQKEFVLAVSCGSPKEAYTEEGKNLYNINTLLSPYRSLSNFISTKFLKPFVVFSANSINEEEIKKSAIDYKNHITGETKALLI